MRLPRSLHREDLHALLAELRTTHQPRSDEETTWLCLLLLVATGLRVSELCSLRICDVRANGDEIRVLGKGHRERVVMVANSRLREFLHKYILLLGESGNLPTPLFRNGKGNGLSPQCLRLRLHKLAKRTGLSIRVTPHMFRHTAATLLLEGGVDIRFVQRLLGHASIATTQIYTHVCDVSLREALERADVMRAFT
jgi:integrase/recombinase XerD